MTEEKILKGHEFSLFYINFEILITLNTLMQINAQLCFMLPPSSVSFPPLSRRTTAVMEWGGLRGFMPWRDRGGAISNL